MTCDSLDQGSLFLTKLARVIAVDQQLAEVLSLAKRFLSNLQSLSPASPRSLEGNGETFCAKLAQVLIYLLGLKMMFVMQLTC